jgi:hypothetical protein
MEEEGFGRNTGGLQSNQTSDQDTDIGRRSSTGPGLSKWYTLIGAGMYRDVKNRLPYYRSDWTDAWTYRVVPATLVRIFCRNIRNKRMH